MVEKCVYGKLADDKVNVKPLQFSVAGAVGAQFNATDHVGLYVETGIFWKRNILHSMYLPEEWLKSVFMESWRMIR